MDHPFPFAVADGGSLVVPLACAFIPVLFLLPAALSGLTLIGRRDYVSKAGLAVAAFCFALIAGIAAAVLGLFVTFGRGEVEFLRSLACIGVLISWTCLVVGFVSGVQGVRESQRSHRRDGEPLRGGALSLGSAVGSALLGAAGLWSAVTYDHVLVGDATVAAPAAAGPTRVSTMRPSLPEATPTLGHVAGRVTVDPPTKNWLGQTVGKPTSAPGDGPSALEFRTFNLRFRRPGDQWCRLDAQTANKESILAYHETARNLRFLMIAERVGVETPFTPADLLEAARTRQRDTYTGVRFDEPVEHAVAGISGKLLGSTFRVGLHDFGGVMWLSVHHGFAYQMFVIGEDKTPLKLRSDALRMFANFELLDSEFIAHGAEFATPAGRRELRPYGCTIDLRDTPWRIWNEHAGEVAAAEYGARIDPSTRFVIVPVRLTIASRDPEAATQALFSWAGIPFAQASQGERRAVQNGRFTGEERLWRGSSIDGDTQRLAQAFLTPYCAVLLTGVCPIDRPDRLQLLRQAFAAVEFAANPPVDGSSDSRRRSATGYFYNEVGLFHYRREEWQDAERYLRAALEQVPDDATYLGNVVEACRKRHRPADALTMLDAAVNAGAKHANVRLQRAQVLAELGRVDDACRDYAALFAAGHRDDGDLRRYVELLDDAGRHDVSRTTLADYRRAGDSSATTVLAAESLRRSGDAAGAATLLESRMTELPHDEDIAYALIGAYRKLKRYREALKLAEQRLAAGKDELSAYYWRGLLEYDLEQFRAAKKSLETAYRLDPDNHSVKSLLEHVTAELGEGENLRIKTPIDPVPLPQAVASALATDPLPEEFRAASAYYADRTTVYKFVTDKELTRTEYFQVVIQNEQGVAEFNTLSTSFDPLAEQVYVNRLEVFDERGEKLAAGETSDYFVLDDSTQGMAVHDKILEMPVPGLQPGCRIELVVTVRRSSPPKEFPFRAHVFGMSYPCRREALVVIGDEKHLAVAGSLAADVRRAADCTWWQTVDRAAYRSEPFAPDVVVSEPTIYLGDARTNWSGEVGEYLEEIAERLKVPDEIRRTAEKQTHGLTDRAEKIATLTDFVRRTISYKAVEFGRRARIMHPADQTLADRYGDCKDMSLLLAQLLESVGVEARPALVHSSRPLLESPASLDQFDHMIVYLPDAVDPRAVDPTDRHGNPRSPVPASLAGKKLFVLDGEQSRSVTLPALEADSHRADVERQVRYDDEGTAHVVETVTFGGYYGSGMRSFFATIAAEDRRTRWQSYLESGGVAPIVRKFAVENLDRRDRPFVVKTEYEVERAVLSTAGLVGSPGTELEFAL